MDIDWDSLTPEQQAGILAMPAGQAPDGFTQQLDHPPNRNAMCLAVVGVALFISTTVVLIRIYARAICLKRVRIEDGFGLLAYAAIVGHSWSIIELCHEPGLFVHNWDVRLGELEHFGKTINLLRLFYCLINLFAKNAILLEWIQLFVPRPLRTNFFWLCTLLITANTMLYIAAILMTFLRCIPQEAMWWPWIKGRCLSQKPADVTVMVFNLVCDLCILALPQRVIWSLNLKPRQKLGISFVFSLGLLTCACAAGRVYSGSTLDYQNDAMYSVPITIMWGVGESTFVMMVFCIPTAPVAAQSKLATRIGKSLKSWTRLATGSRSQKSDGLSGSATHISRQKWWNGAPDDAYRNIDPDNSQVALKDLSGDRHIPRTTGTRGILKTTEVAAVEDAVEDPMSETSSTHWATRGKQHPWMG